ncbi:MAG: ABC transporter ATP-binding protein [Planctomycetota bacterium]
MADQDRVIHVADLTFAYRERRVLEHVSFDVARGEVLAIMGPSGCGKTTLIKLLVGLLHPPAGTVSVLGQDISQLDEDQLDRFRRRIGMLFQFGALINSITVGDNIALPLLERGGSAAQLVSMLVPMKLGLVGLAHTVHYYPAELSGGMRKRAGLARALALDPELLFFDEPTSGLDPLTAAGLDELIRELRRLLAMTMVVVTHDLASAHRIADRLLVIDDGRVLASGTPEQVARVDHPRVQSFLRREAPARPTSEVDFDRYFERKERVAGSGG